VWSTIHEAGHGIYNQAFHRLGLPSTIGEAPGLGMHESQSRMYENVVGRSKPFWEHHFPGLRETFPEALADVDVDDFVRQINTAQRSLIRVEADELTYNLHLGLRFGLERAMINGELEIKDLPDAWNAASQHWLGVTPSNNAEGCLQDTHWPAGLFGYFPTYTLGNVYAAQFVEAARKDLGDLEAQWRDGDVLTLRTWFDEHIYQYGRTYTGKQFVERISGAPMSVEPLLAYLRDRFGV
jgi:carboxypeptidase Taq